MIETKTGGDFEIVGDAAHRLDRLTDQRARNAHLVEIDGKLLRTSEEDRGRAADDDRNRHRRAEFLMFLPMHITARAAKA